MRLEGPYFYSYASIPEVRQQRLNREGGAVRGPEHPREAVGLKWHIGL